MPASAEIQLTLRNTFIEKYKNRTSIEDTCVVDHSKGKANPASKDGDMHVAVRCSKEIALPLVAEIMNAKDHQDAIDNDRGWRLRRAVRDGLVDSSSMLGTRVPVASRRVARSLGGEHGKLSTIRYTIPSWS